MLTGKEGVRFEGLKCGCECWNKMSAAFIDLESGMAPMFWRDGGEMD